MRLVATFAVLMGLMVVLTGCGEYANTVEGDVQIPKTNGPNPNNLPDPNGVPKPMTPNGYAVSISPVTIEEVLIDPMGPDDGNQYVELYNSSVFEADIGGWVVSNGPDTFTFPYGFRLPAGERVVLHVNIAGAPTAQEMFAPSIRTLSADTGSLALLRAGSEVVDFVQWGASGNAFEGAAVMVGEWVGGDYVLRATEGKSINYTGLFNDSRAWFENSVTPGN